LSISLSHPSWLVERWLDRIGFERTEAWESFNNVPAPFTLRVHGEPSDRDRLLAQLDARGIEARPTRFAPLGVVVNGVVPDDLLAGVGAIVQDEASQIVASLAGSHPGPLVLDACAAPGGKATAIAARLGDSERLIACDVRDRRMDLLRQTVTRTGASRVSLVQADASAPLPFRQPFSTVLVDAPCSGLGTLRRDPDIKWRRQPQELPAFAARQLQMLARAADAVAEGGRLIYATCSSEPEENEDVVAAFLALRADFSPLPVREANPELSATLEDQRGHLRTEPDRHDLELFFGAVFTRVGQRSS
jgi:16S rRNA (cytosine967-C5)-methyltransferase